MTSLGATVVAISAGADDIAKVKEEIGVQFPVYADPDRAAIRAWGVADPDAAIAVPATFVVGADGVVRYVHVGENASDRPVMKDVLAVLRYLSDG